MQVRLKMSYIHQKDLQCMFFPINSEGMQKHIVQYGSKSIVEMQHYSSLAHKGNFEADHSGKRALRHTPHLSWW